MEFTFPTAIPSNFQHIFFFLVKRKFLRVQAKRFKDIFRSTVLFSRLVGKKQIKSPCTARMANVAAVSICTMIQQTTTQDPGIFSDRIRKNCFKYGN